MTVEYLLAWSVFLHLSCTIRTIPVHFQAAKCFAFDRKINFHQVVSVNTIFSGYITVNDIISTGIV